MRRTSQLGLLSVAILSGSTVWAADPDLADYRTVENAITTLVKSSGSTNIIQRTPFLGLVLSADPKGKLIVEEIATDSPAAKAGVERGDQLLKADGKDINTDDDFEDLLKSKGPRETLRLRLSRKDKPLDVTATLAPLSRPMLPGKLLATLGVKVATVKDGEGVAIEEVVPGSAAERARLKVGEVILRFNATDVATPQNLNDMIAAKKPDDEITLTLLLADKRVDLKVILGAEGDAATGRGWNTRGGRYWTRPAYKIAIINVEYPDAKHNPKITAQAWGDAMFSKGTYKSSATGATAYGSMHDYYWEQSYQQLKIEGKSFEHVEVSKKRMEYGAQGTNRQALLTEAMDKLLAREGKDALKDFDGVFFIYAGERANVPRGSLYWPHRSSFTHNGKRWDYFICGEGGRTMGNISVFCHEFGHMLGLPDLYARPENPGMEGVGIWSAMANQAGAGRPQHFDPWSKEKLGWIKPAIIDPTVKQKLILAPIEDSPKECFKVLVRPDGSEYFLLENRRKKGYDVSLPAEGLLIWRVVRNRPILQESHGVEGPSGPRTAMDKVPFPSECNDCFTPFTIPSSRSQLGGGSNVYITNIKNLSDGRITFQIGYEYQ
jgi:M6 family metalloprotease-like protein